MFKRKIFGGKAGMLSRVLLVGGCLFSLLSCNEREEVRPLSGEGESVEEMVTIGAGVSLRTKATDAGFEMGDTLGIYLCKWKSASEKEELLASGNYADNAMFRLVGFPDSWESDKAYYYPADGSLLDFYAYYPYRKPCFSSEGTVLDLRVSSDQSSYAEYTRSDFMTSVVKGVMRSSAKVHLDFYHRLSQIVFRLIPGVGFTEDDLLSAQVKVVNAIVDARYDLSQKLDSFPMTGSERSTIVPCGSWVKGNGELQGVKAILIPQEINGGTYIEVSVGSRRFTFKPSGAIRMNPGCSREFTITVSNTGIDIETEIHPWDECPPVSGSTEEENAIVRMTTLADSISFSIGISSGVEKKIEIDWGDGVRKMKVFTRIYNVFTHKYTDGLDSHDIVCYGTDTLLTNLDFYKCKLMKLDVSGNKNLTSLYCHSNQLKVLDVSSNKNLGTIRCYANQLKTLDVSQNKNLEVLWCEDNHLTELNFGYHPDLREVQCAGNQLTSLDLSGQPSLQRFNCMENRLTFLSVRGCVMLGSLICSINRLMSIDIEGTSLSILSCFDNPLVFDENAITKLANSLPVGKGYLSVDETGMHEVIQPICAAKNWTIEKVKYNYESFN